LNIIDIEELKITLKEDEIIIGMAYPILDK
jgi:hypothetical protein